MPGDSRKNEKEAEKVEREIEKALTRAKEREEREEFPKAVYEYQEASRLAGSINDKRAVDFCLDAVKCSKKTGNNFKTGWSYKCAADHSLAFRDFDNAINFAMKAIEYFSKANSMYAVQWCYNIMGRACEEMKEYGLALKNYRKSLDIEQSEDTEKKVKELAKIIDKLKRKE